VKVSEMLLLGFSNPRRLSGLCGIFLGPLITLWRFPNLCSAFVAILGSLQLSCGLPQACTGSVTTLKCPIVDRGILLCARAWGE
jgi:hypothetical protein